MYYTHSYMDIVKVNFKMWVLQSWLYVHIVDDGFVMHVLHSLLYGHSEG
jgi:hypothetical protein